MAINHQINNFFSEIIYNSRKRDIV